MNFAYLSMVKLIHPFRKYHNAFRITKFCIEMYDSGYKIGKIEPIDRYKIEPSWKRRASLVFLKQLDQFNIPTVVYSTSLPTLRPIRCPHCASTIVENEIGVFLGTLSLLILMV